MLLSSELIIKPHTFFICGWCAFCPALFNQWRAFAFWPILQITRRYGHIFTCVAVFCTPSAVTTC